MKQIKLVILLLLLSVGFIVGCSSNDANEGNNTNDDSQTQAETGAEGFPVTVTDATGNELTLETNPEKIISTLPSNTEIAFAIGLDEQLIAVTDNDNYPPEAAEKDSIGHYELNVEKIIELEPDLILAHELNGEDAIKQLTDTGLPVLVIKDALDLPEVYDTIRLIGEAAGATEEAEKVVADMEARLAAVTEKVSEVADEAKKSVFIEISAPPEIYTAGGGTFYQYLIELVNANNVVGDEEGWMQVSEEAIIDLNPEVIIVNYNYIENPVEELLNRTGWDEITAVQEDQVFFIDEDLTSRPGPRLIEGVEELAKAIYPELFAN